MRVLRGQGGCRGFRNMRVVGLERVLDALLVVANGIRVEADDLIRHRAGTVVVGAPLEPDHGQLELLKAVLVGSDGAFGPDGLEAREPERHEHHAVK